MATSKREKEVEAHLRKVARKHEGWAYKFVSPGRRGVPDRICVIPCFEIGTFFAELKSETGKLASHQEREITRIIKAGGEVYVLSSKEEIDLLFEYSCECEDHTLQERT